MLSHWESIKHILTETILSHVNGVNAAVAIGTVYAQVLLVVNLANVSKDIASWAQTILAIIAVFFLAAYNIVRFFRLLNKPTEEE